MADSRDCPTALLVDLAENRSSPKTPGRRTPRRACTLRQITTPKTPRNVASPMLVDNAFSRLTDSDPPKEDSRAEPSTVELLDQQTFDFDLSLSPGSSETASPLVLRKIEDEEEIFFGPIGHKERCISKNIEEETPDDIQPLSPLTTSQMVHLFKEAQTVAYHVKQLGTPQKKAAVRSSQSSQSSGCSPLLSQPLMKRKRKLSSADDVTNGRSPKASLKSPKLESPLAVKIKSSPKVQKEEKKTTKVAIQDVTMATKPSSRDGGIKPSGSSGLRRSASLRIPKSKLPCKGSLLPNSKEESKPRVRHVSGPAHTPTNKGPMRARPNVAKRKNEEGNVEEKSTSSATAAPRKIPRLGLKAPEAMKPGALSKRSLAPPAPKNGSQRVLPKGPLKATKPVEDALPSSARRSLQMKETSSHRVSPKRSTSSSINKTPSNKSKSGHGGTPIKQEKSVNPKRLLSSPSIAPRCSSTSSNTSMSETPSNKRHSALPTFGKNSSFSSVGSRSFRSSVSSNDSILSSPGSAAPPPQNKMRRSVPGNSQNKENSRLASPATRLASKLKPLRISDNPRHHMK